MEAASFLIQHNLRRCWSKRVLTDNSSGAKVVFFASDFYVNTLVEVCHVYNWDFSDNYQGMLQ